MNDDTPAEIHTTFIDTTSTSILVSVDNACLAAHAAYCHPVTFATLLFRRFVLDFCHLVGQPGLPGLVDYSFPFLLIGSLFFMMRPPIRMIYVDVPDIDAGNIAPLM